MILLIILVLILFIFILWYFNFKRIKISNINLITGQLGTGKSFFSLRLARFTYKRILFRYKLSVIFNLILSNFGFRSEIEKPLFYSNIPLGFEYVPLTDAILLGYERVAFKSVIFIDEISMIVDNNDYRDNDLNYRLKNFFKLFRHMSHGGFLFINTQAISDNHYIIKRSINQYLYIHSKIRLPFVSILKVREMNYSDDNNIININSSDIEDNLKTVIVSNKYFKYYDTYCYSILTDNLPYSKNILKKFYKKIRKILSFKKR